MATQCPGETDWPDWGDPTALLMLDAIIDANCSPAITQAATDCKDGVNHANGKHCSRTIEQRHADVLRAYTRVMDGKGSTAAGRALILKDLNHEGGGKGKVGKGKGGKPTLKATLTAKAKAGAKSKPTGKPKPKPKGKGKNK